MNKLTKEQIEIVNLNSDTVINAVAGSGKTTTLVEFVKNLPPTKRVLYIVYNTSAKDDAKKKFDTADLRNVDVLTAHGLAYRHVIHKYGYKVSKKNYTPLDVIEKCVELQSLQRKVALVVASHILRFANYFCGHKVMVLNKLNYLDIVSESNQEFVETYYSYIERLTKHFLGLMYKKKIECTHDFYLKMFQMDEPVLRYDHILFDEGQDASGVMLDIFLKQTAPIKVIVGDTHQQIYAWRYAVNSLESVNGFKKLDLSQSFRFPQSIAELANDVINQKRFFGIEPGISVKGLGKKSIKNIKTKAIISRSNIALLATALDYISKHRQAKIYFEGKISSYTYADDGTSVYDILNLYLGQYSSIKDPLIKAIGSWQDLAQLAEDTEDGGLKGLMNIVTAYTVNLPKLISDLKSLHVDNKNDAEIIFTTTHKAKGVEYDDVTLTEDFIKGNFFETIDEGNSAAEIENINILYVAITRAKSILRIPRALLPKGKVYRSSNIVIIESEEQEPKGSGSLHKNWNENFKK